jgi:hypothetical protein
MSQLRPQSLKLMCSLMLLLLGQSCVVADDSNTSQDAIQLLTEYLETEPTDRRKDAAQELATRKLTRDEAAKAKQLLWNDRVNQIRATRTAEMKKRMLRDGELEMPFYYKIFGDKPKNGRSLYISMHGGGGAPKRVNDQQWENQKRLYSLKEGVYLVPRAPTNTWNLWHQGHIDAMFGRLIENMIVFEDVDPNRVYIMGYSAGGDGVYQLAPRMADQLAAAAMMAGHPNETSPLGLRNIAFTIHVGGKDAAYNRNKIAGQWSEKLAALRKSDPAGYEHLVKIYPDKGHWMDRQDAAAIPWMAKFQRNPLPEKIVWKQDDVTHSRFYWLAVDAENKKARSEIVATRKGQNIDIESNDVARVKIRFNDDMIDFEKPVTITSQGKKLFEGKIDRTLGILMKSLDERLDPDLVFCGEVSVDLPGQEN